MRFPGPSRARKVRSWAPGTRQPAPDREPSYMRPGSGGEGPINRARSPIHLKTPLMAASSAAPHADPYYAAKESLEAKVRHIQTREEKFYRMLKTSNTAANKTFQSVHETLRSDVEAAEGETKTLEQTILFVEANRARFRHIDDSEIAERKAFVSKTKQLLAKMWNNLESDYVKQKIVNDKLEFQRSRAGGDGVSDARRRQIQDNDAFIADHRRLQMEQMERQEQGLDEVEKGVELLGEHARRIGQELEYQNDQLANVQQDMDHTAENMGVMMNKLSQLLKTKDKCQLWTVIILTIILVIMVILVIYV